MKKLIAIIAMTVALLLLSGCVSTYDALDEFEKTIADYDDFIDNGGVVPQSVLDTLDFMLENYTDLERINPDDIVGNDITGTGTNDVEYGDKISHAEAVKKITKALANLEDSVAISIDASDFSSQYLYDMICTDVYGGIMIDTMRLDSYSYNYINNVFENTVDINIMFHYNFPKDELRQMREQTRQKAKEVCAQLGLNGLSDYEKVCAINKYLSDTISYSSGNPPYPSVKHTEYGAMIDGDCVCEGYARATKILADMCDLECFYVAGDTPDGGHAWNLIKVDGQWYQHDVTWNDVDFSRDSYFLVTDDYMRMSRTWDEKRYPASAKLPYKH